MSLLIYSYIRYNAYKWLTKWDPLDKVSQSDDGWLQQCFVQCGSNGERNVFISRSNKVETYYLPNDRNWEHGLSYIPININEYKSKIIAGR